MDFPPIEARVYPWDWPAWHDKENVRDRNRARREMTLGEAVSWLSTRGACACSGPPYCCINMGYIAEELVRTAHIAIKMIQEYAFPHMQALPNADTLDIKEAN